MAGQQVRKRTIAKNNTEQSKTSYSKDRVNQFSSKIVFAVVLVIALFVVAYLCNKSSSPTPVSSGNKKPSELFSANNETYYSKGDKLIGKHLKRCFTLLDKNAISKAVNQFEKTLGMYPDSPLARYGFAVAMDRLSDAKKSNDILQKAVERYRSVPKGKHCPSVLAFASMSRAIERLNFLGTSKVATGVAEEMVKMFPNDARAYNTLGVQYLMLFQNKRAKPNFEKALELHPNNGFSQSHLAFVIKAELKYNESIALFEKGLNSGDEGADDARFYFHLGDAYMRTGRRSEAHRVYADAAKKGHFLSALQRSLYNADTPLKAQPWWNPTKTPYAKNFKKLEDNWKVIRDEGVALLDKKTGGFVAEAENLREKGDWLQFTLYQQGKQVVENCRKAPKTCALIDSMPDASRCKRGQAKYSIMHPGTHIWPHCGPTNCRIRSHLGLVIPPDVAIRCGEETRSWEEGKIIIIDDSFDHEVWHNGTSLRLILIVDFWHPELTKKQKDSLLPI